MVLPLLGAVIGGYKAGKAIKSAVDRQTSQAGQSQQRQVVGPPRQSTQVNQSIQRPTATPVGPMSVERPQMSMNVPRGTTPVGPMSVEPRRQSVQPPAMTLVQGPMTLASPADLQPKPTIPGLERTGFTPLYRINSQRDFNTGLDLVRKEEEKRVKDKSDTFTYKYGKFLTETGLAFGSMTMGALDFASDYLSRGVGNVLSVTPGPMGDIARRQKMLGPASIENTEPVRNINKKWQEAYSFMENKGLIPFEKAQAAIDQLRQKEVFQPSQEWQQSSTIDKLKPRYIGETVTELGPDIVASVAAFAINPLVGMGITGGSVANDVQDEAIKHGVDPNKADMLGLGTGVVVGLLDKVVPDKMFGKAKNKFIGGFVKKLINGPLLEAGTEATQEAVQMAAERTFRDDLGWDEVKTRLGMASIGGILGGGFMSGISTVVNKVNDRARIEETVEEKEALLKGKPQQTPLAEQPAFKEVAQRPEVKQALQQDLQERVSVGQDLLAKTNANKNINPDGTLDVFVGTLKDGDNNILNKNTEISLEQQIDKAVPVKVDPRGLDVDTKTNQLYSTTDLRVAPDGVFRAESVQSPEQIIQSFDTVQRGRVDTELIPGAEAAQAAREVIDRMKIDNVEIDLVDTILTGTGTAFASSYSNNISFTDFVPKYAGQHEAVHTIVRNMDNMPIFKGITKQALFDEARQRYPQIKEDYAIEEQIAEDFELYVKQRIENKPTTIKGKVKQFFDKLYNSLRKLFGTDNRPLVSQFYDKVYAGKAKEATQAKGTSGRKFFKQSDGKTIIDFSSVDKGAKFKSKDELSIVEAQHILKTRIEEIATGEKGMQIMSRIELNEALREDINDRIVVALKNNPTVKKEGSVPDSLGDGYLMEKNGKVVIVSKKQTPSYESRGYSRKIEVDSLASEAGFDSGVDYLESQYELSQLPKNQSLEKEVEEYLLLNDQQFKAAFDKVQGEKGKKIAKLTYLKTKERLLQKLKDQRKKIKRDEKTRRELAISKILTQKEKDARRTAKIRNIRDYFGLSDADLKKIGKRNVRLMTDYEFYQYKIDIERKALQLAEKRQKMNEIIQKIEERELKKTENLQKAMELPSLQKMTLEQLQEFDKALEGYQMRDEFLPARQIQTLDNTEELKGAKTTREIRQSLAKKMNLSEAELKDVPRETMIRLTPDAHLAGKHPFYKMMINEYYQHELQSEKNVLEKKRELNDLVIAARKSRKRKVSDRLIPQDKLVFEYLDSPKDVKDKLRPTMTNEELQLAHWLQSEFIRMRDTLIAKGTLEKYRENYIIHTARSFLEAVKDGGIRKAFKEVFDAQKVNQAKFDIVDDTGQILAFEKFFGNAMRRTGNVEPTKNVAKAYLQYLGAFENKMAIDAITPKLMAYTHAFTPSEMTDRGLVKDNRLNTLVKEWLNNKRGRRYKSPLLKQGSKQDSIVRGLNSLISMVDLGLSIPVGVASRVGENMSNWIALGTKQTAKGKLRRIKLQTSKEGRKVIKSVQDFVGENPMIELVTDASKNISDKAIGTMFSLFQQATYTANLDYLLGSLSDTEYKQLKEGKRPERLNEIFVEMGKYRAIDKMSSILGSTTEGKILTKYKTWAVPHLLSTASNLKVISQTIKNEGTKKAFKSKEFGELTRGTLLTAGLGLMLYMIMSDDNDDSFLGKLKQKIARESMTSLSALDPNMWASTPRLWQFTADLSSALTMIAKLERYKTKDGLKGVEKLKRTLIPSVMRSFFAEPDTTKDISNVRREIRTEREGFVEDMEKRVDKIFKSKDQEALIQLVEEISQLDDYERKKAEEILQNKISPDEKTDRQAAISNLSSDEAVRLYTPKIDRLFNSNKSPEKKNEELQLIVEEVSQLSKKAQNEVSRVLLEKMQEYKQN